MSTTTMQDEVISFRERLGAVKTRIRSGKRGFLSNKLRTDLEAIQRGCGDFLQRRARLASDADRKTCTSVLTETARLLEKYSVNEQNAAEAMTTQA